MTLQAASIISSKLDQAYAIRGHNIDLAMALAKEALEGSREGEIPELIARSLSLLSLFSMIQGAYSYSREKAEEAIKYYEELGDEKGLADTKYNIASIYYKTDNFHLGLVYLVDCLAIYRKFNDYHNQSRTEKSIGTIFEYFGDQKNAIKSYEGAVLSAQKAGDINLETNAYNPLSGILLKQGNIEKATELIEKAIELKIQTGDNRGLAFSIYGRGKIHLYNRNYEEAEKDFLSSFEMHEKVGERLGLGMNYRKLGELYLEMGLYEKAKAFLYEGLAFSNKYNIVIIKFKCYQVLYRVYKKQHKMEEALINLELYLKEKEAVINTQTLKVIENYELIKRMESLEKEARMELEKADIIAKKERAEEAARIKQEFLSTMSHEIRTPLHAVKSIAELLSRNANEHDQNLLKSLQESTTHLSDIINDIIDFTRLDAGEIHLQNKEVHFPQFLNQLKNQYNNKAIEKSIEFNLQLDASHFNTYFFDDLRLSQVINHLINNAVKFTDNGHVDLITQAIETHAEYDIIRIKIKDTGCGIAVEEQEFLFDQFTTARNTTTRKQGGTGLGLAIVKKMLTLFNSEINLESEIGKGSIFYFDISLPKIKPANPVNTNKDISSLKNKICLLAEDNEINAMVAEKLLSFWGIHTEVAKNGELAIEMAKNKKYDFILMDIHMPEMNGYEAACHIRKEPNPNNETPIFGLTADITALDNTEATKCFNAFLWKPLEVEKLQEALFTSN